MRLTSKQTELIRLLRRKGGLTSRQIDPYRSVYIMGPLLEKGLIEFDGTIHKLTEKGRKLKCS